MRHTMLSYEESIPDKILAYMKEEWGVTHVKKDGKTFVLVITAWLKNFLDDTKGFLYDATKVIEVEK